MRLIAHNIPLVVFLLVTTTAFGVEGPVKVSKPFSYSGYTKAEYSGMTVKSAYVPMSDGVKLAIDYYLPTKGPARTAFPVILAYTPYQRSRIDPKTGKVMDCRGNADCKLFVSHGYVYAVADMRGTGASSGWLLDFMPRLGEDGKELVDWIAAQPWCDGKVGMEGGSYVGWSQTATASRAPKALKCIIPYMIPLEGFTGEVRPGGIYLRSFLEDFSKYMDKLTRNYYLPDEGMFPAKPAVDEDGDGRFADEIPVYDPKTGSFLKNGPPVYADHERHHLYYEATKDHEKDYDYNSWASKAKFIDSRNPLGLSLYDLSPGAHVPGMMKSHIPIYDIGGWFDGFTRGTFELYCTMAKTNPSKLLICPSYHEPERGPFWAYFGENPKTIPERFWKEQLRFYDHYLKGVDNGIDREPPICIYVMHGGGWRFEHEWPLARRVETRYYFDAGHTLRRKAGGVGADAYAVDLTQNSSYTKSHGNRWLGIGDDWPDSPPMRQDKDKHCLTYTSAPFDKNTEVTGSPIVHLRVSSTARDGDFFVYLEDVDAKGNALLVTEGQLRAGFAALHNNDREIEGGKLGIDVKPKLPWHGFEKADYNPNVFANGAVVNLVIDYFPTSWVFRKGHRIRVSIACADYPTFMLNPAQSPKDDPNSPDNIPTTITMHRGRDGSYVELPVIPARGVAKAVRD